jgi:hypothetical protein
VKAGKNLVTIDNLVLDLGSFAIIHPGGKFALQRSVGRDISKYFYGGFYILGENGSQEPHRHSLKAFGIAKRMVVARLAGQDFASEVTVARIAKKIKDNQTTDTFCFETLDRSPDLKFSKFFEDNSVMGYHYLLSASSDPFTFRQYTVCNAMNPEFYTHIFKFVQSIIDGRRIEFNKTLLEDGPQNRLYLTIKNYKTKQGLSTRVHAQKANEGQNLPQLDFNYSMRDSDDRNVLNEYSA